MAWLEFELEYYDVAVQYVSHYTIGTHYPNLIGTENIHVHFMGKVTMLRRNLNRIPIVRRFENCNRIRSHQSDVFWGSLSQIFDLCKI